MQHSPGTSFHLPHLSNGARFYSSRSEVQRKVAGSAIHLIKHAIKMVEHDGESPFVICDYGAADGRTTHAVMDACIGTIRNHPSGNKLQIQIIFEDQHTNDFASLFQYIQELTLSAKYEDVYFLASGTSFLSKIIPRNSIHFALSSNAVHWLSKRPCPLREGLIYFQTPSMEEKKLYKATAAEEWRQFLLMRSEELKSGGQLVVIAPTNINVKTVTLFSQLNDSWRCMFLEDSIEEEEYKGAHINFYMRTEEDLSEPLLNRNSAVHLSGLRLVSTESVGVNCPFTRKMAENRDAYSKDTFADELTETLKAFTIQAMYSALHRSRPQKEKDVIMDILYKRLKSAILDDPDKYSYKFATTLIHISKH